MARLTREEWRRARDLEAARTQGKKHAELIYALRFAGPAAVVLAAGVFGWGAWWLWDTASAALSGAGTTDGRGFPVGSIVVLLILGVITAVVARMAIGRARFATLMLIFLGLGIMWTGVIAYVIGSRS